LLRWRKLLISEEAHHELRETLRITASLPMKTHSLGEDDHVHETRSEQISGRHRQDDRKQLAPIASVDLPDAPEACQEYTNERKMEKGNGQALIHAAVSSRKECDLEQASGMKAMAHH